MTARLVSFNLENPNSLHHFHFYPLGSDVTRQALAILSFTSSPTHTLPQNPPQPSSIAIPHFNTSDSKIYCCIKYVFSH
jgi:hypothetical protein